MAFKLNLTPWFGCKHAQPSRIDDGPGVRAGKRDGADVHREMPPRVESDIELGNVVDCSFEIVVQSVDAERVPISDGSGSTGPVPRSQGLATLNFYQEPTPNAGTETCDPEQEPVVPRLPGFPQRAFLSEHRVHRLALRWRSQTKYSRFCNGDTDDRGVLEGGGVP